MNRELFVILLPTLLLRVFSLSILSNSVVKPWQSFLSQLLPNSNLNGSKADVDARQRLKLQLFEECRSNVGKNDERVRERIESIIGDLAVLNPTRGTATSPLLLRKWTLEWTTEKEINFFIQTGISNTITQTLSKGYLENNIPFVKGGGFGVSGSIRPASNYFTSDDDKDQEFLLCSCRTEFQFINAKLDLGKWGIYNFPPVGKGWFDTIYLDDGKFAVISYC
ncbi:hypothetical protein HJC23_006930 [Cyclotella cryptica]|uniref:Plastid lipid-associated protein/fibrillin conserved domain-containing protein n=1 Tax=Cyclotella cryptica TaxID=29204 RepID=A0ABD3NN63_9STRA|eukprot:CCRYP_020408-RB/>CCRYP_020408-RB protein AED:0.04 eAED:0.04 QI:93/1/1/1/1/1/2/393/222